MVKNLQANISALREFVLDKSWSIVDEKEIAHGYQLTVTDGTARTPVALFASGKVLVQGKPSKLQAELKSWCYGRKADYLNMSESAQLSFIDTQPKVLPTTRTTFTEIPRIGSDESGKGDYFGPLVVAAVFVNKQTESQLIALNVRDSKLLSDNTILRLSHEIRAICRGQGMIRVYNPEQYNELYKETSNLNFLLATAHAQTIAKLQKTVSSDLAIVDQFGDEALVRNALLKEGSTLTIEQRTHAEDDTAVAAASIVARAEFVQCMTKLSQEVGIDLPKGASDPKIEAVGREIVMKKGRNELKKVAKLHFRTTATILQNQESL